MNYRTLGIVLGGYTIVSAGSVGFGAAVANQGTEMFPLVALFGPASFLSKLASLGFTSAFVPFGFAFLVATTIVLGPPFFVVSRGHRAMGLALAAVLWAATGLLGLVAGASA